MSTFICAGEFPWEKSSLCQHLPTHSSAHWHIQPLSDYSLNYFWEKKMKYLVLLRHILLFCLTNNPYSINNNMKTLKNRQILTFQKPHDSTINLKRLLIKQQWTNICIADEHLIIFSSKRYFACTTNCKKNRSKDIFLQQFTQTDQLSKQLGIYWLIDATDN